MANDFFEAAVHGDSEGDARANRLFQERGFSFRVNDRIQVPHKGQLVWGTVTSTVKEESGDLFVMIALEITEEKRGDGSIENTVTFVKKAAKDIRTVPRG